MYIYIYICMYIVNSKLLLGETLCREFGENPAN